MGSLKSAASASTKRMWPCVVARPLLFFYSLTHLLTYSLTYPVEAAVSKGADRELAAGGTNQGGGVATSTNARIQSTIGEAIASMRLSSASFRIVSGFVGAALSDGGATLPVSDLDIQVLDAKTNAFGPQITPQTWQRDHDPILVWEAPPTGPEVAGYSYAIDGQPDDVIDTTGTSYDVASNPSGPWADGKHTFAVKAVNLAGNAGQPISLELWIDTTPPQIVSYTPLPGSTLTTASPPVQATVSDVNSGANQASISLLINGSSASITFDEATGAIAAVGGAWQEGVNHLELRVADVIGNTQVPLIWSLTIDTVPPVGTITINGDADLTTSVYVTLVVSASDETSGVTRMLLSNEEASGYVEEPLVPLRELWRLNAVRGPQRVYVKFVDRAGNISGPVSDAIELVLLSPETLITSGPAGMTPSQTASLAFMCPEGGCVFSFAFDNEAWSEWAPATSATNAGLPLGNHYFRVKAAKDVNGAPGIQADEEDPSPAERTWIVGVASPILAVPKGPPIKLWRLE